MRLLLPVLLIGCACFAQKEPVEYRLTAPKGWEIWMLARSADYASIAYTYSHNEDTRAFVESKIRKGEYAKYVPGDLAMATGEKSENACHVRLLTGESKGREGWVHEALMNLTEESKAYLAKVEERKRAAEASRRAAARRLAEEKKRAADEVKRAELAYINSLPRLAGPADDVVVATSMDCAKDLQGVVNFGRKNGTGVEFRKKIVELVTLGCATTMPRGTPIVNAVRNGQFVTFRAYKSSKISVALVENVRWP
jgi:hypothetical protein